MEERREGGKEGGGRRREEEEGDGKSRGERGVLLEKKCGGFVLLFVRLFLAEVKLPRPLRLSLNRGEGDNPPFFFLHETSRLSGALGVRSQA